MKTKHVRAFAAFLGFAGACQADEISKAHYLPHIEPAAFHGTVDNPYFPLVPGTVKTFIKRHGVKTSQIVVEVTRHTRTVMGVACIVVHDMETEAGRLIEDTYDWYAQADDGTVWYFGEDTREFKPGGEIDISGAWEAGKDGAQPGIVMPATPLDLMPYRQEFLAGKAEDVGQIVSMNELVTVPAGSYTEVLKTKEWSMVESGTEQKWYAKDVGVVREVGAADEITELTAMSRK